MGHSLLDLPPDVLARTLGLLANDLPALAACCAASHSLCTAAGYILAQLQSLTLRGGAARSPALAALLPRTRSLASLDLSHCYGWLDPEACRLVASIPTLHTLKLDGCRGVTRAGLAVRLWGRTGCLRGPCQLGVTVRQRLPWCWVLGSCSFLQVLD